MENGTINMIQEETQTPIIWIHFLHYNILFVNSACQVFKNCIYFMH